MPERRVFGLPVDLWVLGALRKEKCDLRSKPLWGQKGPGSEEMDPVYPLSSQPPSELVTGSLSVLVCAGFSKYLHSTFLLCQVPSSDSSTDR